MKVNWPRRNTVIGGSWTTLETNLSWASPFRNTWWSIWHVSRLISTHPHPQRQMFFVPVLLITEFKRQVVAVQRWRGVGNDGQVNGSFNTLHFADDAADLQFHAGAPADHHLFRFVLLVRAERHTNKIKSIPPRGFKIGVLMGDALWCDREWPRWFAQPASGPECFARCSSTATGAADGGRLSWRSPAAHRRIRRRQIGRHHLRTGTNQSPTGCGRNQGKREKSKDNNKTHRSRNETEILARPPMRNVKQLVFTDGNTGGPPSNVQKWNETNDNRGRIVATLKIISADQRSHWLSKIKVSYFFLFFPSFIFPLNKKKILFR